MNGVNPLLKGAIVLALLSVLACGFVGCSKDGWQRSRGEYCTMLYFAKKDVKGFLNGARERLKAAHAKEEKAIGKDDYSLQATAKDREYICSQAQAKLSRAEGFVRGFDTATHILARGREDSQSVEEAGFALETPGEPFSKSSDVHHACRTAEWSRANEALAALETEYEKRVGAQLRACESTGWTPPTQSAAPEKVE